MSRLEPIAPEAADGGVAQLYGRIQEMLGNESMPGPFAIYAHVEPFLKDFYMNFKKFVYTDGALPAKTKAAIALAVSAHAKCRTWREYFEARCQQLGFSEGEVNEILAVSATNYMYNTFFKFRQLSGVEAFGGMSVGLRAHTFSNTSLGDDLIELINIVISDINACEPCTSGHVTKAAKLNQSHEAILEAIQCAATMYAGAQFLNSVE